MEPGKVKPIVIVVVFQLAQVGKRLAVNPLYDAPLFSFAPFD